MVREGIMKFCCKDFKELIDDGVIEEDKAYLRSQGCFEKEKYVMMCRYDWDCFMDVYIKFCPRCGKDLTISKNK